jgi:hypothetical protein
MPLRELSVHMAEMAYIFGSAVFAMMAHMIHPLLSLAWPACEHTRFTSATSAAGAADCESKKRRDQWGGKDGGEPMLYLKCQSHNIIQKRRRLG